MQHQVFNFLEISNRVGNEQGVIAREVDWRRSERAIQHAGDLEDHFLPAGVFEREDLGSDAATGRHFECALHEQRRRLRLGDEVRDDLEEFIALLDDRDAVKVKQGLDREEGIVARNRGGQRKRVDVCG